MLTIQLPCPKCGLLTRLKAQGRDIVQVCLCGLHRYVQREKDGLLISKCPTEQSNVALPNKNTKMYRCVISVLSYYPKNINTKEVALAADLTPKETSSFLVMLMTRGILERVEGRRGLAGGSVWKLTPAAVKLLKANDGAYSYGISARS